MQGPGVAARRGLRFERLAGVNLRGSQILGRWKPRVEMNSKKQAGPPIPRSRRGKQGPPRRLGWKSAGRPGSLNRARS